MPSPEQVSNLPKDVQTIAETPAVPEHIQKVGVSPHQSQFSAQVTDDNGQQLISSVQTDPENDVIVPMDQGKLEGFAAGSVKESVTWFAVFWLRVIKRALHLGRRVVVRGRK